MHSPFFRINLLPEPRKCLGSPKASSVAIEEFRIAVMRRRTTGRVIGHQYCSVRAMPRENEPPRHCREQ